MIYGSQGLGTLRPTRIVESALPRGANATSFDALQILLGFSDNKDGRALVAELSLAGFDGVRRPIPAVLPDGRNFSVEVSER